MTNQLRHSGRELNVCFLQAASRCSSHQTPAIKLTILPSGYNPQQTSTDVGGVVTGAFSVTIGCSWRSKYSTSGLRSFKKKIRKSWATTVQNGSIVTMTTLRLTCSVCRLFLLLLSPVIRIVNYFKTFVWGQNYVCDRWANSMTTFIPRGINSDQFSLWRDESISERKLIGQ